MMKEDKKLQDLLKGFAIQETSAGFEDDLMQKIAALKQEAATSQPLISETLKRVLIFTFITVIILLITLTFSMNANIISQYISISIPAKTYVQLFYFLASFWIVMSFNLWWNKRKIIQSYQQ